MIWQIIYTSNHWANEVLTLDYIQKIILPYISKKQEEKGFYDDQCALLNIINISYHDLPNMQDGWSLAHNSMYFSQ